MFVSSLANRHGEDALLRPLSQLDAESQSPRSAPTSVVAEVCTDKREAHEGHDEMRTPRGRPPTVVTMKL